jgi:hypothetical protein
MLTNYVIYERRIIMKKINKKKAIKKVIMPKLADKKDD